tara:strand:+ start:458 stop:577 length:120 start_codon:yes stop_codon:yes gene_type:complete
MQHLQQEVVAEGVAPIQLTLVVAVLVVQVVVDQVETLVV